MRGGDSRPAVPIGYYYPIGTAEHRKINHIVRRVGFGWEI